MHQCPQTDTRTSIRPANGRRRYAQVSKAVLAVALAANLATLPGCSDNDLTLAPDSPTQGPSTPTAPTTSGPDAQPSPAAAQVANGQEIRGGRLHRQQITSFAQGSRETNLRSILGAAQRDLPGIAAFVSEDFRVISQNESRNRAGDRLVHVTVQQTLNGIPIDGSYLRLTSRVRADNAQLASSSYRLYSQPQVNTTPAITREDALAKGREHLRLRRNVPLTRGELLISKIDGKLELVYEVASAGSHKRALIVASGDRSGHVVVEDTRVFEGNGTVTGFIVEGGAPGSGNGQVLSTGLAGLTLNGASGVSTTTAADGSYTIAAAPGEALNGRLSGRAADVHNISGADLTVSGAAGVNVPFVFGSPGVTADQFAQVNAYHYTERTRQFLEANGFDSALLGAPLTTNVNLPDVCNAFYSPFERTINFFSAGGGCSNTAIDTVVAHEYGHFADDMAGGITEGGLSEGWGDLLGCYILNSPIVGEDFFPGGGFIRSCENDYVYPPGGNDGVHNLGQSWAGFAWRVRQGFIAQYGYEQGDALARALVLPSLMSNAPDIPEAVREVFLRDDNDGDLSNQTPNWAVLHAAASHHGLAFAVEPDTTAPAAVTNLGASEVQATAIKLQWTATGDDDLIGTASAYDIRISNQPIDESNFFFATQVPSPAPAGAGSNQSTKVLVAPNQTIYVALRVVDEQFNTSALSNVISVTTPAGVNVYADGAETGGTDWSATGLWHVTGRRASEGAQSFWYGQEATGNYDTGTANAGTLTSPVISLASAIDPVLSFSQFRQFESGGFYDAAVITVTNVNNPAQTVTIADPNGDTLGAFTGGFLSLGDFAGASIQITFSFDTVDGLFNDSEGWYVDDIRVVGSEEAVSNCAHDLCVTGEPLDPTCDDCVATVCSADPFCCQVAWDSICVAEAGQFCGACGGGGGVCGDGVCDIGEDCSTCPFDCGTCPGVCGDGVCSPEFGEDCSTCPFDCGTCQPGVCGDGICSPEIGETCSTCSFDCGTCPGGCTHDVCEEGGALDPSCSDCAATVCAIDAYCCQVAWDALCVNEAAQFCGACNGPTCGDGTCSPGEDCTTCPTDCGTCPPACEHDLCAPGAPLDPTCDSCAATVCAVDDFCCTTLWDRICVQEAEALCGLTCQGCAHSQCDVGEALDPTCDDCTNAVCSVDPYCCNNTWDSRCVNEATQICGLQCEQCVHSMCDVGSALSPSCDPCVSAVCAADSYCCNNAWDERCVEAAEQTCGLACETFR